MSKNVLFNIFYVAEYVAFILATIAVIVFQFTASEYLVVSALILYVVAFGIMTTNECIGVQSLKKKLVNIDIVDENLKESTINDVNELNADNSTLNKASEEDKTVLKNNEKMQSIKKQIGWGYAKIIACAVFCIFSFVVLVLF